LLAGLLFLVFFFGFYYRTAQITNCHECLKVHLFMKASITANEQKNNNKKESAKGEQKQSAMKTEQENNKQKNDMFVVC
jgi:hypothetical protein